MTNECFLESYGSTHFICKVVVANKRVMNEVMGKCGLTSFGIAEQGHSLLHNICEAEVTHLQLGEEGGHFLLLFLAALHSSFLLYPRAASSRGLHHTCYISARIKPQSQHTSLLYFFFPYNLPHKTISPVQLLNGQNHLSRVGIGEAIINLSMQLRVLVLLLLVSIMGAHVLRHFDKDIVNINKHYAEGETSKAYSILMKMLIQTKTLYEQLDLPHPNIPPTPVSSCPDLMQELVHMLSAPGWIERYQDLYVKLHGLQQRCTSADFRQLRNENGFDDTCALCTVLTRVMENYIAYHRKDVAHFVEEEFCSMFDGLIKPTCEVFVHYAGPRIIRGLLNKEDSDQICHASNMCKDPKCRIFGAPAKDTLEPLLTAAMADETKPSPWQWLIDIFTNRFGDKHNPPFDLDNDSFSDISTFRGYHWRGVDCNQLDNKVYPGRKVGKGGRDHDCNGIFGKDAKGDYIEQKMCGKWTRLGVGVVGDSAGAHFSIPEKFFNVTMMQKGSFHDLLPRIADKLDIPQESAYTGHVNTTYAAHSIYKYLRKWNICNNNDFQNLGVNGGDSGNSWGNIKALQRSQATDHPMLLFIELIGNDVCGSSVGGTNPADFKKNIRRLLDWLDTKLPKGSHVMIFGLADGDLLYEYLQGTIHPLDVTYDKVYDFLNCLKISPCAGWLNTNATARSYTTELARNLSKIYQQIIDEGPGYTNYDLVYHDFPIYDIFERMYLDNREPREMIERCDGFHPSVLFNSYLADWTWYKITTDYPHWIGEQNPNNQDIKKMFGLKDLE